MFWMEGAPKPIEPTSTTNGGQAAAISEPKPDAVGHDNAVFTDEMGMPIRADRNRNSYNLHPVENSRL